MVFVFHILQALGDGHPHLTYGKKERRRGKCNGKRPMNPAKLKDTSNLKPWEIETEGKHGSPQVA